MKPEFSTLTDEALAAVGQAGDESAVAELVARARPMARRLAASLSSAVLERDDAESLCVFVFMKTLPRYNPKLSPLMPFWAGRARCAITDYYRSVSRVGRGKGKLAAAYMQEIEDARHNAGRDFVDISSFAKRHGVSERLARNVALNSHALVCIDAMPDSGSFIADELPSPATEAESVCRRETAGILLRTLSARDREIVERYYGINGHSEHTLKEISAAVGVTKQRVQQLLARTIERLRSAASTREDCSSAF